jgi:Neprosin
MRRITIEELSRFETLEKCFQKSVGQIGASTGSIVPAQDSLNHKYAVSFQNVSNSGGSSWLNFWSPAVNTALTQGTSISQHWYQNTTAITNLLQTVEGGWIVYPQKFGPTSVLFVYWTADGYTKTGCLYLESQRALAL